MDIDQTQRAKRFEGNYSLAPLYLWLLGTSMFNLVFMNSNMSSQKFFMIISSTKKLTNKYIYKILIYSRQIFSLLKYQSFNI